MQDIARLTQTRPRTKSGISALAKETAAKILADIDVHELGEAWIFADAGEELFKQFKEELKPEVMKYHTEFDPLKLHGSKVVSTARAEYDYSHDAKWVKLDATIKKLTEEKKAREEFLRVMPDGTADAETGEILTKAQVKSIKQILTTTLAK